MGGFLLGLETGFFSGLLGSSLLAGDLGGFLLGLETGFFSGLLGSSLLAGDLGGFLLGLETSFLSGFLCSSLFAGENGSGFVGQIGGCFCLLSLAQLHNKFAQLSCEIYGCFLQHCGGVRADAGHKIKRFELGGCVTEQGGKLGIGSCGHQRVAGTGPS